LSNVFEPVVLAIPKEFSGRLEPAEIFHQVLEHRWYLSENAGKDVTLAEAVDSYVKTVLVHRRDEEALITPTTGSITMPNPVKSGVIQVEEDDEDADWRDLV
jgi:hypothetical protein